jgi:hypothetical protein
MTPNQTLKRRVVLALIVLLSAAILFHLLVLVGVVPHDIVWGGRLESEALVPVFEGVSLSLNALFLGVSLIEAGYLPFTFNTRVSRGVFVTMGVIFTANTVGNLLSRNAIEQRVFTGLTLLIAIFCFVIAAGSRARD